jgi:hypothetical protein
MIKNKLWATFVILFGLSVVDFIITLTILSTVGTGAEVNPLMRHFANSFGIYSILYFKLSIFGLLAVGIQLIKPIRHVILLYVLYALNLMMIGNLIWSDFALYSLYS